MYHTASSQDRIRRQLKNPHPPPRSKRHRGTAAQSKATRDENISLPQTLDSLNLSVTSSGAAGHAREGSGSTAELASPLVPQTERRGGRRQRGTRSTQGASQSARTADRTGDWLSLGPKQDTLPPILAPHSKVYAPPTKQDAHWPPLTAKRVERDAIAAQRKSIVVGAVPQIKGSLARRFRRQAEQLATLKAEQKVERERGSVVHYDRKRPVASTSAGPASSRPVQVREELQPESIRCAFTRGQ
eukprot:COSAG05_NODE_3210_length_2240_cov_4.137319_2_plen_244_part_00